MADAFKLNSVGVTRLNMEEGESLHIVNVSSSPSTVSIFTQNLLDDALRSGLTLPVSQAGINLTIPNSIKRQYMIHKSIVIPVGVRLTLDDLSSLLINLLSVFIKDKAYIELEVGEVDVIVS
tara:strand:+ start:428 stop:793 length:366 start_codon:yes stop_codon:yes gene_type:complete